MDNKGFTLVELIVAVVVSSLAAISIVLIMRMSFTNYRSNQLESQIQIESQVVTEQIKDVIQSCEYYDTYTKDGYEIIEICSYNSKTKGFKYYNYLVNDNKCYLKVTDNSLKDTSIFLDNFEFLANYIDSLSLTPNKFDYTDEENNKYDVQVEIGLRAYEIEYVSTFVVHIKSNN